MVALRRTLGLQQQLRRDTHEIGPRGSRSMPRPNAVVDSLSDGIAGKEAHSPLKLAAYIIIQ